MTRVGHHGSGPHGGDLGSDLGDGMFDGRHGAERNTERGARDRMGGMARHDLRHGLPDHHADGRLAEFRERIRHALDEPAERDEAERPERLLAVAIAAPPQIIAPADGATPVQASAPATSERVAQIAERVEQAVRAEMFAGAGQPISLRLDLAGLVAGMQSVVVAVSAAGIDVTLAFDGPPDPALVEAAQSLADRLQSRFQKRVVRVLEADPAEPAATGGLDTIAMLLANREPGR